MDHKLGAAGSGREPAFVGDESAASPQSLLGELRHVYLLPDLPADVLSYPAPIGLPRPAPQIAHAAATAALADTTWEQVFAHVRRLVQDEHRPAA